MGKLATIICFVITFLLLGGIAVLIAWLADKMKSPMFSIDQANINGYNFTADNHLNATFILEVRSHNRDSKYQIKYDLIVVSVYHSGYTLAYDSNLGPFTQHHGEDIVFTAQPRARNVLIRNSELAGDIRNEARAEKLGLEVHVRAAVRYEVARWKHKSYVLRIICTPVFVGLSSGKGSQSTICDVDRF
ncbi:uncharacterized protein LOC125493610 [Beta vulgaris subsp. vulgaris]|uniref:uncharacterized protein LOC125493610 n=1 Tax=Beta vulgaris subsp. vulgaris TaxID=3555 RepID=UPI002037508B|nr:uncharacterized protein LOC125493610 [Beta vulgaris subsp. vulgaris]